VTCSISSHKKERERKKGIQRKKEKEKRSTDARRADRETWSGARWLLGQPFQ
jgi:hypothetical protein